MAGRGPAGTGRLSAQELAAATPVTRNRYADLLRVVSIFVVVLGHWTMAVLAYRDGKFVAELAAGRLSVSACSSVWPSRRPSSTPSDMGRPPVIAVLVYMFGWLSRLSFA